MNKLLYFILSGIIFISCSPRNEIQILVENKSNIDRDNEIVEINIAEQLSDLYLNEFQSYKVIDFSGSIISSQISYDKKLLFQSAVKANEQTIYTITIDTLTHYQSKNFGRHYPERKGDFAWENDRVGFRFYGKELKGVQAPTSGLDLWYKRTDKLVLDEWYQKNLSGEASYHVDHGEGCDPYAVGQTLGGQYGYFD